MMISKAIILTLSINTEGMDFLIFPSNIGGDKKSSYFPTPWGYYTWIGTTFSDTLINTMSTGVFGSSKIGERGGSPQLWHGSYLVYPGKVNE